MEQWTPFPIALWENGKIERLEFLTLGDYLKWQRDRKNAYLDQDRMFSRISRRVQGALDSLWRIEEKARKHFEEQDGIPEDQQPMET